MLPAKSVMRFGKKGKLSLRFLGPFEILEKYEDIAYKLVLPPNLLEVRLVFYVSMLQRYRHDDFHVIHWDSVALD
ncbi:hypothetical protein MTR67_007312 [Solanum verrucosum]|uniref:Tf2-1-like SH3-like domain-containing protein n=1 Tax=Solanum verrucosum TaxID=315347 RepID=A0AAF0TAH6_SOLVR|nr:hypothetical protein MTR67_007312 [Solanum verrucosum]